MILGVSVLLDPSYTAMTGAAQGVDENPKVLCDLFCWVALLCYQTDRSRFERFIERSGAFPF